ncbi:MAG: hypothetical protein M1819_003195 [Sarea resinae]|nr:MAG: hypothetical protein M1819_003195 [Sarea resinae]
MAPVVLPPGYAASKDLPKNPACVTAFPDLLPTESTGETDPSTEHNVVEPSVGHSPGNHPFTATGVPDHYLEEAVAEPDVINKHESPPFSAVPLSPQGVPEILCLRGADAKHPIHQLSKTRPRPLNSRDFISKSYPNTHSFASSEEQTSHSETTWRPSVSDSNPAFAFPRRALRSFLSKRSDLYTEHNAFDSVFSTVAASETETSHDDHQLLRPALGINLGCFGGLILVCILGYYSHKLKRRSRRKQSEPSRTRQRDVNLMTLSESVAATQSEASTPLQSESTSRTHSASAPTSRRTPSHATTRGGFPHLVDREGRSKLPPAYSESKAGNSANQLAINSRTPPSLRLLQPATAHLSPDRPTQDEIRGRCTPPPEYTAASDLRIDRYTWTSRASDHYEMGFMPDPLVRRQR